MGHPGKRQNSPAALGAMCATCYHMLKNGVWLLSIAAPKSSAAVFFACCSTTRWNDCCTGFRWILVLHPRWCWNGNPWKPVTANAHKPYGGYVRRGESVWTCPLGRVRWTWGTRTGCARNWKNSVVLQWYCRYINCCINSGFLFFGFLFGLQDNNFYFTC